MSEQLIAAIVTVLLGIIGVAVLAMLVSGSANTAGVIGAGSGGFACMLKTAVTGQNQCGGSLSENVNSTIHFGGF